MKSALTWLVSIILVIVLVTYTFCFQVRYDQVAVLTTFGKATDPTYSDAAKAVVVNRGSLCLEPGLYFKWPWPIQRAAVFPKTVQLFEAQLEELQTSDHYAVIVKLFVAWHIDNPLDFFVKAQNEANAEKNIINPPVRQLKSIFGEYAFAQLVNINPKELQFDKIEDEYRDKLQSALTLYGIKVDRVGIRKIILPDTVTEKVFASMKKSREALAEQARSEGTSQALSITSQAKAAKDRILAFAESRAIAIRTEGDKAAAEWYSAFERNQPLAIFLRQIEVYKKILAKNTTFILPADQLGAFNLLGHGPTVPDKSAPDKNAPSK